MGDHKPNENDESKRRQVIGWMNERLDWQMNEYFVRDLNECRGVRPFKERPGPSASRAVVNVRHLASDAAHTAGGADVMGGIPPLSPPITIAMGGRDPAHPPPPRALWSICFLSQT